MLLTPFDIERAASDIVSYWETSDLPDADKEKILEMVKDYYEGKNEYLCDQYLSALTTRTLDSNVPKTGFENKQHG